MSEYWHNGSIILDRALTDAEKAEAARFFDPYYPKKNLRFKVEDASLRFIHPLLFVNTSTSAGSPGSTSQEPEQMLTCLDFEDYLTGRDFDEVLLAFCKWCGAHNVGIDPDSVLSYYGDDDGAYDFPNGELRILDRDEYGALNCDTGFLISEVFGRKNGIKAALAVLPTEALLNELNRRGIYDCPVL